MNALTEQIAEVLELHRPYGLDCKCGEAINSDAWWAAHAAEQVAALFTEETHNRLVLAYDDPPAPKENNRVGGPDQVWATHYELVPSSRHVSEWEPQMEHADSMRPWTTEQEKS